MTWIKTISIESAKAGLKQLYNRVKGPDNNVDNIMMAHSLRPHTMKGHMVLYKNVLHHKDNTLPKSLLETIGVYVSLLNHCDYCVLHHFEGLKRLIQDEKRANEIFDNLKNGSLVKFSEKEGAILEYSKKLTLSPKELTENDVAILNAQGLSDGEILEVNQVTSYFNYANRTVLGLGITIEGDILGLSPNDNDSEDNWSHQ